MSKKNKKRVYKTILINLSCPNYQYCHGEGNTRPNYTGGHRLLKYCPYEKNKKKKEEEALEIIKGEVPR